jgi:RNA polymerase sigma-70 factor (ECF subfamily)
VETPIPVTADSEIQSPAASPSRLAPETTPSGPDPGPLDRLWREHAPAVYRAAHRITGNPADAEDVLQTVFLRLARRQTGGLDEQAGGYLHRSAVNAALDVLRSRQRAGWVPLESEGPHEPVASAADDPEAEQRRRDLRRHLRLALSRLSPRAAETFALRYFEGLPNHEIAALLGVSQGVVAVLLHRTRARLRKELVALNGEAR